MTESAKARGDRPLELRGSARSSLRIQCREACLPKCPDALAQQGKLGPVGFDEAAAHSFGLTASRGIHEPEHGPRRQQHT
jgi:hypothetical protein